MEKKIWFTSDTHFGHIKNFLWAPRGFNSIEEHDEAIIKNWNEVVEPDDIVYHLGDVMLNDNDHGMKCISRLNGHIHLILGNHDTNGRVSLYEQCLNIDEIVFAKEIKIGKNYFFLCHYPVITANYDDDKPWAKHLINLYGHTHQQNKFYCIDKGNYYEGKVAQYNPYMYNVGLDAHNNRPVELQEILNDIKEAKIKFDNKIFFC